MAAGKFVELFLSFVTWMKDSSIPLSYPIEFKIHISLYYFLLQILQSSETCLNLTLFLLYISWIRKILSKWLSFENFTYFKNYILRLYINFRISNRNFFWHILCISRLFNASDIKPRVDLFPTNIIPKRLIIIIFYILYCMVCIIVYLNTIIIKKKIYLFIFHFHSTFVNIYIFQNHIFHYKKHLTNFIIPLRYLI